MGLCFMGQMGVYVFFCILSGLIIDKLNPHKLLLISSTAQFFITLGFFATVWYGSKNQLCVSPVTILIILMSFAGVTTAFYWPVMMGWISTGYEGAELSKRFGFFNMSWGTASMIMPIIAGYLAEVNNALPVFVAIITSVLCFAAVVSCKYSGKTTSAKQNQPEQINSDGEEYCKTAFVWMARIALLSTFICVGIFRSQVGIFYKFELGFAESFYGWSVAIMCFFNVAVFYAMGKSHWWHYKKMPFVVSTAAILLSMLIILLSKSLAMQFLSAAFGGICYGFVYSSHQYYGVSGGKKRSALMAIHEIIIGAGVSSGALFSGIVSDAFGRYSPYKYACMFVLVAAIAQIVLWFSMCKKQLAGSRKELLAARLFSKGY